MCILIGVLADGKGRSGIGFFLLSFFLSPILGGIALIIAKNNQELKTENKIKKHKSYQEQIDEIKKAHHEKTRF